TFPQSLPLDRFIQAVVVPWLGAQPQQAALAGSRVLGLAASTLMALLSGRLVDSAPPNHRWTTLIAIGLAGGAYLCVLTGSLRDWPVLLPWVLVLLFSFRDRAMGRGGISPVPELAMAAALLLHRSALCLIPAYLIATYRHLVPGSNVLRRGASWL